MTTVRIAHVEPRPGWQPDGGFRIHSFLVVLADDPGGRALPIWLIGPQGHGLWQIVAPGAWPVHEAEAQTSRLLQAAGVAVTGADIDELDAAVTAGPRRGRPDAGASARIEFTRAGAGGPRQMQVPLGYALALAAAFGAPVRVAGEVMDSLGVATRGEDLLGVFLGEDAPRAGGAARARRAELRTAQPDIHRRAGRLGVRWQFPRRTLPRGRLRVHRRRRDRGGGVRRPDPEGFAALAQSVLAHKYVGRTVTFRAEVRTEGVANEAGLHLLGGMPTGRSRCRRA